MSDPKCQKKGMREKIGEILYDYRKAIHKWFSLIGHEPSINDFADQILSLTHDDWEMVEKCPVCLGKRAIMDNPKQNEAWRMTLCSTCRATGEITRPATINEVLNDPRARRKG